MKFFSAVILAGGKSSRMGFDKQKITIENSLLIKQTINKLKQVFKEIIVVTNNFHLYKNLDVVLVSDEISEKGPLAGIHIGLKTAVSDFVYFIACDMPYIELAYIDFMINILNKDEYDGCVFENEGFIEPFNSFYKKSLSDKISKYIKNNDLSISNLISNNNFYKITKNSNYIFENTLKMFENINTPIQLEKYNNQNN